MADAEIDYATRGVSIQAAMLDRVKRHPDKATRPDDILWAGHRVRTGDRLSVPGRGYVRAEILSATSDLAQGFDLKVGAGGLVLSGGERVKVLRTWHDPELEPVVEYPFVSGDGAMWVWNVYRLSFPNGATREEKWTGNAGFWVEQRSPMDFIYHCSHGLCEPANFASFVFRVSVRPH